MRSGCGTVYSIDRHAAKSYAPATTAVEPAVEEATLPLEAFFEGQDDEPDVGLPVASPAEPDPDPEPAPEPIAEEAAATRRPVQKKKGRASVPSWDEIMFGSGSDDPGTRS